ncbi:MAG: hypothetical protein NVV72_19565 [Asticcacaulis sp.]|nr:hypothetical protein [Asticcacaulis sp.]
MMNFELRLEDIDPEWLIETTYKYGPFYTCGIGGRQELSSGRFYGDAKYQFCYYEQIRDTGPDEFMVHIYKATSRRFFGDRPDIISEDIDYIKENITFFYKTFDIFTLGEFGFGGRAKRCAKDVKFNWGIW